MFAIVELTSSLINFSRIPITNEVKLNQDFNLLTYLLIGLSLIIVVRIEFDIRTPLNGRYRQVDGLVDGGAIIAFEDSHKCNPSFMHWVFSRTKMFSYNG